MSFDDTKVRVAIVGAGVAGLMTSIAFKRQLRGFDNFLVFEQGPEVGGTWQANSYPGCACDIASHFYSLSTDPSPYWSSLYAGAAEIKAYWQSLMYKYNVHSHVRYNTSVESATWDDDAQAYRIVTKNTLSGLTTEVTAEILISAIGLLSKPRFPNDIPGREDFKGASFHSAQWRHDVSLQGKRVAVIGNGCSAAQVVPAIAKEPGIELINFTRSKQWYFPRSNPQYSETCKWIFAHIPLVQRIYRLYLAAATESMTLLFYPRVFGMDNSRIQESTRKMLLEHLKRTAPPEYHDTLIADYPPGCKRLVVDIEYLKSLHRQNVTLSSDRIEAVTPEGIRLVNGQMVPLDVIVFATGFDPSHTYLDVTGKDGRTLGECFEREGGPSAYWGTTMPNFPNFFTVLGPNTITAHTSVIWTEECQIGYIVQMIRPIIQRRVQSFEVMRGAMVAYNTKLQRWISNTIWTACASWYRSGKDGKNVVLFPLPMTFFMWNLTRPRWEDYIAVGAEKWISARRRRKAFRALLVTAGLAIAAVVAADRRTGRFGVQASECFGQIISRCSPFLKLWR